MMTRRLQDLRAEAALSIRDLAKLAGISTATIVKAEHGATVYPSTVRKLAAALEVTPLELMGGEPNGQQVPHPAVSADRRAALLRQAERARQRGDDEGAARFEAIASGLASADEAAR